MPSKPIQLGHLSFAKQGDAVAYFSALLNRLSLGASLSGSDYADVEALLSGHPRAQEKIGTGIISLVVDAAEMGGRCFHVVRQDGSRENFSIKKCIAGDPPPFTAFSAACRHAVESDLITFKKNYFAQHQNAKGEVKCPETKNWISAEDAHVDHRSPQSFSVIVKFFVDAKSIDLSQVAYKREGLYGAELADQSLQDEFRAWHTKTAVLRIIEASRNLAKSPLARVKLTKADRKL